MWKSWYRLIYSEGGGKEDERGGEDRVRRRMRRRKRGEAEASAARRGVVRAERRTGILEANLVANDLPAGSKSGSRSVGRDPSRSRPSRPHTLTRAWAAAAARAGEQGQGRSAQATETSQAAPHLAELDDAVEIAGQV